MEGKIDLTIESGDIGYYLKEVIRELCQEEIERIAKEQTVEIIRNQLKLNK
jgi:hypothetical protein